ncbi:hypothetical protein FXF51_57050 [Nonomuraea sp. PA05]|uniref:hypothetical protein n=1 Tax=Nonomuraea sp. PA05 TaxID=2604466 RepID=UPI0011D63177|nr:hypothetical protein [Nonomuraea sp. PA05]TYB50159.1 hypothetical protein FXF51_57050 [Nonomuraea sp. PA05]
MNLEALILDMMLRIRTPEKSACTGVDITAIGILLVLSELNDLRTEMRQDVAALGDELAGLRRHMNEHLTILRCEMLHRLGTLQQTADQLARRDPADR